MRVLESPLDGQVIQAANDDELVRALMRHHEEEGAEISEEEARRLVEAQAYEATDA
jgi:hypothetical protein